MFLGTTFFRSTYPRIVGIDPPIYEHSQNGKIPAPLSKGLRTQPAERRARTKGETQRAAAQRVEEGKEDRER